MAENEKEITNTGATEENSAETTNKAAAEKKPVKEAPATFRYILGEKLGMTQLFDNEGHLKAVSVIKAGPCRVVRVRTPEKDGYSAICLGFEHKTKNVNKADMGHFKKIGLTPVKHQKEYRVTDTADFEIGQTVSLAGRFEAGDFVDVQGKTKGHGFAGGMKRHGFAGQPASHGASDRERAPGSLGSQRSLGKVLSGQRMAGHFGFQVFTISKQEVVKVDAENNLIYINGSVPGAKGTLVTVLETSKNRKRRNTNAK